MTGTPKYNIFISRSASLISHATKKYVCLCYMVRKITDKHECYYIIVHKVKNMI